MTVPRILNVYIAPFFMGMAMAACGASGEPIESIILLISAGVAGYFSLPNSDEVIERIWDAMV